MKKGTYILLIIAVMFAFTACGNTVECDLCGEEKSCKERTVLGETMYICNDCIAELSELGE